MFSSNTSQVSNAANYIEDVFSTYLYTGNGSTQTITNGIDLAGKGGLTWIKNRLQATNNKLTDTVRGATKAIISNTTGAQTTDVNGLTSFNSNGFSIGTDTTYNINTNTYVSWTFRKQPKFFDVVTYTGDGATVRTIAHSLGSVPGCIIVKRTDTTSNWMVYHRSLPNFFYNLQLNLINAQSMSSDVWELDPSSTEFYVGSNAAVNASGGTYVAYLFAHNAGGFGLTGTDNVISCGSFTTDANGQFSVNLGYEPQFVITKSASGVSDWRMFDTMRGFVTPGTGSSLSSGLLANSSLEEIANWLNVGPNATGFSTGANGDFAASSTFIYIAIRRGPMKVPTDATKVFEPALYTGDGSSSLRKFTSSTVPVVDSVISMQRGSGGNIWWIDRLRGNNVLRTWDAGAESNIFLSLQFDYQGAYSNASTYNAYGWNVSGANNENYFFRRAPGFFDEVCYTGNAVNGQTYAHNLGVAPELMIIKRRDTSGFQWIVYAAPLGASQYLALNLTDAAAGNFMFNATAPTASVFTVSANQNVNGNGTTLVNYLFASAPGVSKVGSYTGNGTSQTINCGFTGGARFVLLKRTDSTGDWYVYDTARGMALPTDPYLLLNSTAAEVATLESVVTVAGGFAVTSTFVPAVNVSGGTYIYLAIS